MKDLIKAMESIIDIGNQTKPQPGGWGIYSYCDVNAICGGGAGGFYWFNEEQQLLELSRYLCWFFLSEDEEHDPILFAENGKISDALAAKEIDWETARGRLNQSLEGWVQVEWWEQVDELIAGPGQFAEEKRNYFWIEQADNVDEEDVQPIPPEQLDAFLEWLSSYA